MKKLLGLLLVAAAFLPIACTRVATGPEVTLRFYIGDWGGSKSDIDLVWNNVAKLSKSRLNAKFDVQPLPWWPDYPEKIKLLIASGDRYDMHFDGYWCSWTYLVAQNALLPLNDLFDKYAPKLKADMAAAHALEGATVKGKILGIPWIRPQDDHPAAMINEDLRQKYGIPPKFTTIEDLENYLLTVKKGEPTMRPFEDPTYLLNAMACKHNYYFVWFNLHYTYSFDDPSLKVVGLEETPAFREAAQIAHRWYKEGLIEKDQINDTSSQKRFDNGQCIGSIFVLDMGFGDYPFKPMGYYLYPDNKSAITSSMGNGFAMNAKAANPERTMMFLEWMNEKQENYDAVLYGVEGKTFVFKDYPGVSRKIVDLVPGQDMAHSYLNWYGRWGMWRMKWMRGGAADQGMRWMLEGMPTMLALKNSQVSPLQAFYFDPEPVKTEMANVNAIWANQGRLILYGMTSDPDKAVADMIARCKKAGGDKIKAEFDKQIAAYLGK